MPPQTVRPPLLHAVGIRVPGLTMTVAIALVATVVGRLVPVLGSALPAVVIGLLVALVRKPGSLLAPGITFSSKFLLQLAVVLLGAQLSLSSIGRVGLESLPVMLSSLVVCLLAAWGVGRMLGVVRDLRTLIGVGTAICGASAIAAVAPVIAAAGADVAYAVSTIFLFNILAVALFPLLGHALGMDAHTFGLLAGTAVNDTSSVVAAAGVFGASALGFAVVVKLVRALMIIPVSIGLSVIEARRDAAGQPLTAGRIVRLVPWFLLGFLIVAVVNSLGVLPPPVHDGAVTASVFLIAVALAGIGLSIDVAALRRAGWRPLTLGAILWVLVTATTLAAIALTTR
ncbi:YeiH family protein [Microbacterium pseudoresistens]|uniref:Putative integral membrane protein (TIGR00698 family) n=1 Tax=Microbacterium pseudoresistens TaxID=640634 RepID=A0A7Y9JLX3_9MICO|nr:putative sulfate exporter family transporter [Microbacterium pseudoresistens]NYD54172.1 putative integral membrane protein (TIGR00698 family) [Microbacterium pseudoresistens]